MPEKTGLLINLRGDVAELLLYDVIGEDLFGGVTAKDFRAQLKGLKAGTLNLRINSPGGSVFEASAIMAALDEFKGRIEVDVDGVAASAASVIAMAGDHIRVAPSAMMMIHNPHAVVAGGAADMRGMADLLDKSKGQLLDAYQRHSKAGRAKIAAWMDAETWFAGQEAVDAGFAHAVSEGRRVAACAGLLEVAAKLGYRRLPEALAAPPPAEAAAWAETAKRKALAAALSGEGGGPPARPFRPAKNYSDDQERDEKGRFGSGGGGHAPPAPLADKDIPAFVERNGMDKWRGKLTAEEQHAADSYQANSFGLNQRLRSEKPYHDAEDNRRVEAIDAAIAKAEPTKEPVVVMRGLRFDDQKAADAFKEKAAVGKTFQDHAFVSTSLSKSYVDSFFNNRVGATDAVVEIRVPAGTKMGYFSGGRASHLDHEREMLLERGSNFKVVAVEKYEEKGTKYIVEHTGAAPRDLPQPPARVPRSARAVLAASESREQHFFWEDDDLDWED